MIKSLRNKYFGWLLLLILIMYMLIFSVFFAIELHESHIQKTPFTEEFTELFAVAGVMFVTMPATVILAWNVTGRLLRPLQNVLVTAERISQGNLSERIPVKSTDDELSKLSATINEAFNRYETTVMRLEHFSADASHQLKTPMAAIRTAAEVALQRDRTTTDYQEVLGDIIEQTDKLNRTIEQLLQLSRIDSSIKRTFTSFDLAAGIRTWIQEFEDIFSDQQIGLTFHADRASIMMAGNEILLREVFNNMINNALVFLKKGGNIDINLHISGRNTITWLTEDSGPGIPASESARIFDRFFRGSNSSPAGSGLGLAIVQEIVQLHEGTVEAGQSVNLGGARFTITFPSSSIS
jgi:signal transduction histidine kinase